jgi:hypothetical protein
MLEIFFKIQEKSKTFEKVFEEFKHSKNFKVKHSKSFPGKYSKTLR